MKIWKTVSMKAAVAALALGVLTGCSNKTSYSDVDVNRNHAAEAAANSQQASSSVVEQAVQEAQQQGEQTAPAAPQEAKMPDFVDAQKGSIKDIPDYPGGQRTNTMIGPIGGIDTALVLSETFDPVDKVAAFYDKAIKTNGWTVAKRASDPQWLKLELSKPPAGEGLIEVRRDDKSNRTFIKISRIEKPADTAKKN